MQQPTQISCSSACFALVFTVALASSVALMRANVDPCHPSCMQASLSLLLMSHVCDPLLSLTMSQYLPLSLSLSFAMHTCVLGCRVKKEIDVMKRIKHKNCIAFQAVYESKQHVRKSSVLFISLTVHSSKRGIFSSIHIECVYVYTYIDVEILCRSNSSIFSPSLFVFICLTPHTHTHTHTHTFSLSLSLSHTHFYPRGA